MTAPPPNSPRKPSTGILVVAAIIFVGAIMGAFVYRSFAYSSAILERDRKAFIDAGLALDAEACLDRTLEWYARCDVMKALCDASVPRMLKTCLAGADRSLYCKGLGDKVRSTRFGYHECENRGLTRRTPAWKACAVSYRAIANFCETTPHGGEKAVQ